MFPNHSLHKYGIITKLEGCVCAAVRQKEARRGYCPSRATIKGRKDWRPSLSKASLQDSSRGKPADLQRAKLTKKVSTEHLARLVWANVTEDTPLKTGRRLPVASQHVPCEN